MVGTALARLCPPYESQCNPTCPGFPAEHRLLARDAPVIAGQRAALAERAMARHHERHRVAADGGADGARRLRVSDLVGDVGIADRAAHRDLQQRLPHPHLEIGADQHHAQRLVRPPQPRVEDALREVGGAVVVLDIGRVRPAPLHVGKRRRLLAGIGEGKPRQPAVAGDHDRGAEWRSVEAVAQRHAGAAVLPFARRHRFMGDEQIMQPARARQPGVRARHRARWRNRAAGPWRDRASAPA